MDRRRLFRIAARVALALVGVALLAPIACYGVVVARQTEVRQEAAPPTGRFVEAGDVELFVQEAGPPEGPAVVLVHGTGAWSEIWRGAMEAVAAEGHRAIALDMPPFGYSERPEDGDYTTPAQARGILGAAESLGLRNVTLVAHSFGSRAAMEAVLLSPGTFSRVVLVDAALDLDGERDEGNAAVKALLAVPPVRNVLVASTAENPLLTRPFLEALIHDKSAATPETLDMLRRPLSQRGLTAHAARWLQDFLGPERGEHSADPAAYARLPPTTPVTLVWGAEDTVTPLSRAQEVQAVLPHATLVTLPGVGHIPHLEDPAAFERALVDALGR